MVLATGETQFPVGVLRPLAYGDLVMGAGMRKLVAETSGGKTFLDGMMGGSKLGKETGFGGEASLTSTLRTSLQEF